MFFLTDKESEITEHIKICKEQKIIKEEEYIKVITELSNYRKKVFKDIDFIAKDRQILDPRADVVELVDTLVLEASALRV